ncbi:cytochrome c oxidase subunit II [Naumannella sp. ID2617S]|nr:cytochrome c oxidase subunit II [Naumannella sp. ID2617S]
MRLVGAGLLGLAVAGLSGCSATGPGRGHLFGLPDPTTEQAPHIGNLWVGSWIACLVVGAVVWGLMFWAFARYRRRHSNEVPRQTRYNLPMEIMYTVVPFLIIGVLFFYTVQAQDKVLASAQPTPSTHTVKVVGQKWSWTFNYANEQVWDAGTIEKTPDLYLPVNETTTFELHSPDVIHSFWVPSFYMKMDVIPGRTNTFQVTPNKEGVFAGKCAELCGTYHSAMLFNLHVVPRAEFDRKMAELKSRGQTGENLGSQGANQLARAKKEGE